jgi:hypothetical protein
MALHAQHTSHAHGINRLTHALTRQQVQRPLQSSARLKNYYSRTCHFQIYGHYQPIPVSIFVQ